MKYLLDTDTCIYLLNGRPNSVTQTFRRHRVASIALSSITTSELRWGVAKSGSPRNRTALEAFLASFQIAPYDDDAARAYGDLRAELDRRGTPIGAMDLLIAAQALALDVILVTNNEREFKRVPGLRVENWTRG
jgi:tRNA(fMet)-specific endonuclease VapC